MIYDTLIKNLITQAYPAGKDVFFAGVPDDIRNVFDDNVKTLFLLPGAFSLCGEDGFTDVRNYPTAFNIPEGLRTLFADVRFMADENFRCALTKSGFSRIAVMFSECADVSQYGYRQSFAWIGEYRGEREDFVQLAAFVSPFYKSVEKSGAYFGGGEAFIVADDDETPAFSVNKTDSEKSKLATAAALCEKYAFDRTVVYFNSRQEAAAFRRLLERRHTDCLYLDGAVSAIERRAVLTEFMLARTNILVATKAYIPSSFFCPPERVIFCGVPFSVSHLYRCASACKKHPPAVIYCDDDIRRNEKIIASLSEVFSDSKIQEKRLDCLENIVNLLKSNQ